MDEKRCFKCGAVKAVEEFYRHPKMADGRLGKCKACARADVRRNRVIRAEKYRQYDKARAMRPDRVMARQNYLKTTSGRISRAKALAKYWRNHPEKRAAHNAVNNAIRNRRLQRKCCEVCGSSVVEAHHEDYSRPLDVRWLCRKHHAAVHRKIKENQHA